jgi:hypothetical protein
MRGLAGRAGDSRVVEYGEVLVDPCVPLDWKISIDGSSRRIANINPDDSPTVHAYLRRDDPSKISKVAAFVN